MNMATNAGYEHEGGIDAQRPKCSGNNNNNNNNKDEEKGTDNISLEDMCTVALNDLDQLMAEPKDTLDDEDDDDDDDPDYDYLWPTKSDDKDDVIKRGVTFREKDDVSVDSSDDLEVYPFPLHQAAEKGALHEVRTLLEDTTNRGNDPCSDHDSLGYLPLHLAAKCGDPDVIDCLLDHGEKTNIDSKGLIDDLTPLHVAIINNNIEGVKCLISRGADIQLVDNKGRSALHFAADGLHAILDYILQAPGTHHRNLNKTDDLKRTPLHYAVLSGSVETTCLLLDLDVDIEVTDADENSPLYIAARDNHPEIVELLIEKGGSKLLEESPSSLDGNQVTPLELACLHGSYDSASVLIRSGVKTEFSSNKNKLRIDMRLMFAIHRACADGELNVLRYFMERFAPVDMKNGVGFTPLMTAVYHGKEDIVEELIRNDAALHLRDFNNKTCFHIAVEMKRMRILEILVEHAEPHLINGGDSEYKTPLHYAARDGNKQALQILLSNFNRIETDHKGRSPLHLAAESGNLECVELLVNSDTYPYTSKDIINMVADDEERSTSVSIAAALGYTDICKLLIKKGGNVEYLDVAETSVYIEIFEKLIEDSRNTINKTIDGSTTVQFEEVLPEINCLKVLDEYGKAKKAPTTERRMSEFNPDMTERWQIKAIRYLRREVCAVMNVYSGRTKNKFVEMLKADMEENDGESDKVIMGKLIKFAPSVAEYALDKSVKDISETKRIYNFELLDIPHRKTDKPIKQPFFAPDMMNKYHRSLLTHPVTSRLLKVKWERLAFTAYILGVILYVIFIGLLTALVIYDKAADKSLRNKTITDDEDNRTVNVTYHSESRDTQNVIAAIAFCLTIFQIIKELGRIWYIKWVYIEDPSNFFELATYLATLLFLVQFLTFIDLIETDDFGELQKYKWEAGAVAILLAWTTLLLYFKWIPSVSIYIWMFEEVSKTVVRVIVGLMSLLIAFAFSFYILLSTYKQWNSPGRAMMKTIMWTFGEFDFSVLFTPEKIKAGYREITLVIFIIFLVVMPILYMNLMVGLAVGNIAAVKETAISRNYNNQIRALDSLNKTSPKFILRKLFKRYEVDDPKTRSLRERFRTRFTKLDAESADVSLNTMLGDRKASTVAQRVVSVEAVDGNLQPVRGFSFRPMVVSIS